MPRTGDSFPVTEVQKYSKKGNSYELTCSPVIGSPIGSYTRTEVETELLPDESSKGCVIVVNTIVECKGMWGLDGKYRISCRLLLVLHLMTIRLYYVVCRHTTGAIENISLMNVSCIYFVCYHVL